MQTIVAVDIRDRVATLTLNRPDASNALTLSQERLITRTRSVRPFTRERYPPAWLLAAIFRFPL